jgi:F-type H+-transporting ATPase subunit gamma
LISATKFQRATERALASKAYAEGLNEIVKNLGNIQDYQSPILKKIEKDQVKKATIVVVGTDRGFIGSMLSNIEYRLLSLKKEIHAEFGNIEINGISIFKTGLKTLQHVGIKDKAHFPHYNDKPAQKFFAPVYSLLLDLFKNNKTDLIYLVWMDHKEIHAERLLPLALNEKEDAEDNTEKTFNFEPSQNEILHYLLKEYFQTFIYSAVLNSIAAEYSNRMIAMKNATNNANDLVKKMNLKFNKARQGKITQELIELASAQ